MPTPQHPKMKSTGILLAVLVAAINLNTSNGAWIGRPLSKLPRSSVHKRNNPARPLLAEGSPFSNIMEKPMRARGGSSLEMATNPLITTLIPRIGILTSTLLYFSPMAAVRVASKDESLGELNPTPLALMAVSSLCWLVYGLSIRDPYVTLSNVPGSIASIWYITSVLPLLKGSQLKTTQNIVVALSAITINLWTYLSLTNQPIVQVRATLGLFASALFVVMAGSPLSTIKTVLSSKNSGSILTPLAFAQVVNTALWSVYGLAIKDKFVYGPNMTGLGFGLVQLLLKLAIPSK
mmetsp:Transcript_31513/g.54825  ORF Transcript_31513/g.54825 Transcript_31513/m.54825 type:complete len:293 (-) Transcript_31513:55-933(-)